MWRFAVAYAQFPRVGARPIRALTVTFKNALPRPLLDRINGTFNRAIAMPNFKTRMVKLGSEATGGTAEEFAALITPRFGALG